MEVVIPIQAMDFEFNSARSSSPFLSAPSTPKRFGEFYYSTPTSPSHLSQFYHDFEDFSTINNTNNIKTEAIQTNYEDNFAFDVGDESEKTFFSAEELFDGGKIRPLNRANESEIRKSPIRSPTSNNTQKRSGQERGRERVNSSSSSNSSRRGTRSLSPYRVSTYPWEEEEEEIQLQQNPKQISTNSKPLSESSSKGFIKWKLKDFFLFRSASEGRATDRDPLKKHIDLFRKHEDVKISSFRSLEGSNSGSGSGSRRKGHVSAHELHYKMNRAVSEDLKKKTFLPYKQGILGRLAFNPTVHALTNGFGFSRKR